MKKGILLVYVLLAGALAACGSRPTPAAIPTVVLNDAKPSASAATVSASGEIIPVRHLQLSFPLTGVVRRVEVQTGEAVTAGQVLITLDTSLAEAAVKEAQAELDAAETQVHYLKRVGTAQEHLDSAQADADRAQARLESAQAALGQATLTAPIGGTIAAVDVFAGEIVVPGQVVIALGDLSQFQLETTDLSERDVPAVRVGAAARVFIHALDEEIPGKVVDVARIASTLGGDVVYRVTIALDEQPEGLRWGMSADVEIETGK